MIYLDLPNINPSGSAEQQLAEIRSYIYKSNERLNATLANLTIDKIWEDTANAVSLSVSDSDETAKALDKYTRLRDLIIKTADVVVQSDEKMEMAFNGTYLAKSQFGDYLLNTSVKVGVNSTGFTDLFSRHTELDSAFGSFTSDLENYIKRGYLGEEDNHPVCGIEVGLLLDEITYEDDQGVTHTESTTEHFRTRMTPTELGFYQGNTKVAHIASNAIHFPSAHITGGSISIGVNNNNQPVFHVDSSGNLTARSGTFYGDLAASKVQSAWNDYSSNRIQLDTNALRFYSSNNETFRLTDSGISLYKRADNTDEVMSELKRSHIPWDSAHWGIELGLKTGLGEYFSIGYPYTRNGYNDFEYAFTYVPPGAPNVNMAFPFDMGAGLYINSPIKVLEHDTQRNTYSRYNTVTSGSFIIGSTTYYIRNGLITTS